MSERYDYNAIEKKWQDRWAREREFAAVEHPGKAKYYMLEMLPYPSGALHLGHHGFLHDEAFVQVYARV